MWVFLLFPCGKTTFLCMDKDRTLTYQRLTGFMTSFAYLGFLDTWLNLGLSLFPIHLVLRYWVTFGSRFYQTWFSVFQVVIYFVKGCLTVWSRCSYQLVSELGSKNQVIFFIFFLLVLASLGLIVFDSAFDYLVSRAW